MVTLNHRCHITLHKRAFMSSLTVEKKFVRFQEATTVQGHSSLFFPRNPKTFFPLKRDDTMINPLEPVQKDLQAQFFN